MALKGGWGLDLATGGRVWIRRAAAGDAALQHRRSEVAALVRSLRVPGMATLVDSSIDGRGEWLEVYGGLEAMRGGDAGKVRHDCPLVRVRALLARAGCDVRTPSTGPRAPGTDPLIFLPIPLRAINLRAAVRDEASRVPPAVSPVIGSIVQRRDELDEILEVVAGQAAGPRMIELEAPGGAGLSTLFHDLAREVRALGYVPLSSRVCASDVALPVGVDRRSVLAALKGRHVLVLDDRRDRDIAESSPSCSSDLACMLGCLDYAACRPHLVVTARLPAGSRSSIAIGPMRPDQLERSVLCAGVPDDRSSSAVAEAIRGSGGWPGRFVLLLKSALGVSTREAPYRRPRVGLAHVMDRGHQGTLATVPASATAFDVADCLARASAQTNKGRHAAAERLLRRAIGSARRRGLTADAARLHLALGRLHAARGRRKPAHEAYETCRRLSEETGDADGIVRALLHLGAVLIDDGALQEAESALRAAEVAACQGNMRGLAEAARLLVARCLYWQGQRAAAWRAIEESADARSAAEVGVAERPDSDPGVGGWSAGRAGWLPAGVSAIPVEIGVRVALRDRDAGQAARRLAAAGDPDAAEDPARSGMLRALAIRVKGALGEIAAVQRELASGIEMMRRLHAPVAAQELRIAHVEALLDAGDTSLAASHLRRLIERRSPIMSGLARLRVDEIAGTLSRSAGKGELRTSVEETHVEASAVVQILQRCHEADDDRSAVAGVCHEVRSALDAAAVSAFSVSGGGAGRLVANAGGRACRSQTAERSAAALMVIGPESAGAGREAAAPVRYAGRAVGAIVARWAADVAPDEGRAMGVLVAAAAALGPAMAALDAPGGPEGDAGASAGELSGTSAAMADLRRQIARAAAAPFAVLVQGESGTGKELIARAIHAGSLRRHRRFCAVNCAALSDELFETELFGHARGAFTGAAADRAGLFEEADGGTLLLDEVGELSQRAQAKLLRAIQEGEVRRVGENHPRRVDTRIVAATNRRLEEEVRAGRFRQDLLFRLDVVRIVVPPLRERPEDIAPLAQLFWREATRRTGGSAELAPATLAALARYDWPGNVRELQNTLAALAVHAPVKGRVGPTSLPAAIAGSEATNRPDVLTLDLARRRFEERFVRATLARTGGRRSEAAAALGLSRQGLSKLITRLGIGLDVETEARAVY